MRSPVKPKKFLGQHFLKDMDIARRIAETMIGYAGVPILEIGPGTGVLTRFLLAAGHDLTVVEIDRESVAYLRAHFPELDNRILEEDFLKLRLDKTFPGRFCVIGNILTTYRAKYFSKYSTTKTSYPVAAA